jgi:hypothetical protein
MSTLFAAVCSIAPTRRRRFLWAAWWTGNPSREPFRKPDAFEGGARTRAEALANAERVAGMHLVEIEPRWARAWGRVLVGQQPWLHKEAARGPRDAGGDDKSDAGAGANRPSNRAPGDVREPPRASIWTTLGVSPAVTQAELKRAFRARALERHPDRGGTADAFRELQRAFEEAQRRLARPRKKKPGQTK